MLYSILESQNLPKLLSTVYLVPPVNTERMCMFFRRKKFKYIKKPERSLTADENKPSYLEFGLPLSCNVRQHMLRAAP